METNCYTGLAATHKSIYGHLNFTFYTSVTGFVWPPPHF